MPLSMQIAELAAAVKATRLPFSGSNLTFGAHVKIIQLALIVSISVSLKKRTKIKIMSSDAMKFVLLYDWQLMPWLL